MIAGKRVWARQMRKEPRRCLKCQSLTARHLSAGCNQQVACGTCGRDHQMGECLKTNRDAFWCVSCNSSGHASWDRLCLAFLVASSHMEVSDPEYFYKYFPGQEAWTWKQQPGHGDFDLVSWCGPVHVDSTVQDAWGLDQQRHQEMVGAHARDIGWPRRMNATGPANGGQTTEQVTARVASRQSRIDEYPLIAPGGITYNNLASGPA